MASTAASPAPSLPDWENLGFRFRKTDCMFLARGDARREPVWQEDGFLPVEAVSFSPGAAFLSYGLGIFEGTKVRRAPDGRLLLFRPEANAARFAAGARAMLMEPFPEARFVEVLRELARRNERFVPPADKGTLYVRPTLHGSEELLGFGRSKVFSLCIYSSPVGAYFGKGADSGVRLKVLEQPRVASGGTGAIKAMGNYAAPVPLVEKYGKEGFNDVLFVDALHRRFLTETSGSNVFVVLRSGKLVTPPLDDQILPGVTRNSVLRVARELLHLEVEERPIPVEEAIVEGAELFCTGTAWTLRSVTEIEYRGNRHGFPKNETAAALAAILLGIQHGRRDDPFGWNVEV